jgi:hypothetical protein
MLTVLFVLIVAAFGTAIASAIGKCPVWVPLILLCVVELIRVLPLGK